MFEMVEKLQPIGRIVRLQSALAFSCDVSKREEVALAKRVEGREREGWGGEAKRQMLIPTQGRGDGKLRHTGDAQPTVECDDVRMV